VFFFSLLAALFLSQFPVLTGVWIVLRMGEMGWRKSYQAIQKISLDLRTMAIIEKPSSTAHKLQIIILWVFCLSLPLVYSPAGVDPSLVPRQVTVSFLLMVLGGLVFFVPSKSSLTVGIIPLLLFGLMASYGVSCVQALNLVEARYITLKVGVFVSVGWMMYALTKQKIVTINNLSLMLTVAGMLTTLLAVSNMIVLQSKGVHLFESDNMYKVNATFGHKNLLSSFLFLCLPMFGFQLAIAKRKVWKLMLCCVGVVLIGVIVLLQTRAVLLAACVCGMAVLFLLMFGLAKHLSSSQKRISVLVITCSILLLFSCLYVYRDKLVLLTRTESCFLS
jgi:hypothetical protein